MQVNLHFFRRNHGRKLATFALTNYVRPSDLTNNVKQIGWEITRRVNLSVLGSADI